MSANMGKGRGGVRFANLLLRVPALSNGKRSPQWRANQRYLRRYGLRD